MLDTTLRSATVSATTPKTPATKDVSDVTVAERAVTTVAAPAAVRFSESLETLLPDRIAMRARVQVTFSKVTAEAARSALAAWTALDVVISSATPSQVQSTIETAATEARIDVAVTLTRRLRETH